MKKHKKWIILGIIALAILTAGHFVPVKSRKIDFCGLKPTRIPHYSIMKGDLSYFNSWVIESDLAPGPNCISGIVTIQLYLW